MGIIFPRKAHRPACYYEAGNEMMLLSPGAVDMGGLIILPRKQDYSGIEKKNILKIFSEVSCSPDIFNNLVL